MFFSKIWISIIYQLIFLNYSTKINCINCIYTLFLHAFLTFLVNGSFNFISFLPLEGPCDSFSISYYINNTN